MFSIVLMVYKEEEFKESKIRFKYPHPRMNYFNLLQNLSVSLPLFLFFIIMIMIIIIIQKKLFPRLFFVFKFTSERYSHRYAMIEDAIQHTILRDLGLDCCDCQLFFVFCVFDYLKRG